MGNPYLRYSDFLKTIYGEKVYKLPVSLPVSCPNRRGKEGGCIFCGEKGAGFENLSCAISVREQLEKNKAYIGRRYNAGKFIAYFQNYTNTFMPLNVFKDYMEQAQADDIVEIAVATRPDCVSDKYLDVLYDIKQKTGTNITVELGLQSVNPDTLVKINRGHGVSEYIDAVMRIKQYGFFVCTHMMLNLPWDTKDDTDEGAKLISVMNSDFVKLHALYIVKGTEMARLYEKGEAEICSLEEYKGRVISFLRLLRPSIAVERIIGRAPEEDTVFSNWGTSWWKIRDDIERHMTDNSIRQGDGFDYLNGKALKIFKDEE